MKARTAELTIDQLDALRCFSAFPEAVALVADPTAAAITTMRPVDDYWIAGFMSAGHIGPDGIRATLRDKPEQVTVTVPELQAWSRDLPDWARAASDDDGRRTFFHQFTMAHCANPTQPARHPPATGTGWVRTIRICRTPWAKYKAIEKAIDRLGHGFDFPYPCRWCMRWIIYPTTDPAAVATAVADLNELGVILDDTDPPDTSEQGTLW